MKKSHSRINLDSGELRICGFAPISSTNFGQVWLALIRFKPCATFAPTPMNTLRFFAKRNAVKDFSVNLRSLRQGHSRAVEGGISVRECDLPVFYGPQFLPPRISLQHAGFPRLRSKPNPHGAMAAGGRVTPNNRPSGGHL